MGLGFARVWAYLAVSASPTSCAVIKSRSPHGSLQPRKTEPEASARQPLEPLPTGRGMGGGSRPRHVRLFSPPWLPACLRPLSLSFLLVSARLTWAGPTGNSGCLPSICLRATVFTAGRWKSGNPKNANMFPVFFFKNKSNYFCSHLEPPDAEAGSASLVLRVFARNRRWCCSPGF